MSAWKWVGVGVVAYAASVCVVLTAFLAGKRADADMERSAARYLGDRATAPTVGPDAPISSEHKVGVV